MRIQRFFLYLLISLLVGCSAHSKTENLASNQNLEQESAYSSKNILAQNLRAHDITVVLAFSGGGTRAAALSYGVMLALRDTSISINGEQKRLLDEVDVISSVSGGSFTSAYYGLYGDQLFTRFAQDFLYEDIEQGLLDKVLSFDLLFSRKSRTEKVTEYYQENIFQHKTFADIRKQSPLLIINATDLGSGVRFSFLQEYFDLICSDLNTYPIASAVTASSAVPVVFSPIALKNQSQCATPLLNFNESKVNSVRTRSTIRGLKSYADKEKRPYIHLVDGGITDNLGLLALSDIVELSGGGGEYIKKNKIKTTPYFIIISVDASTFPEYEMDKFDEPPSVSESMSAMTDIQLHRYNDATKVLIEERMQDWVQENSRGDRKIQGYFIDINLQSVTNSSQYRFINDIPTALSLDKESIDVLINEGEHQLKTNPKFQQLLKDLSL